jgi:DNA-binding CsgD family transcriptional regulator
LSKELIQQLYGLSGAEAKLCVAFLETGSLPLTVDRIHVSRNTAKTHLKRIFEKVGVRSQAELLLELTRGFNGSEKPTDIVNPG